MDIESHQSSAGNVFNDVKGDPSEKVLAWKHPFTCIVAGPTSSGKTKFVLKLLENSHHMFTEKPQVIMWFYGEFQKWMLHPKYQGIEFIEGLPRDIKVNPQMVNVFIIDDLMHETDESIAKLFTKGSHHKNISVILLTQNVFHQNKHSRCINLNAHYMVIFKNVRDASQITNLAKQIQNYSNLQDMWTHDITIRDLLIYYNNRDTEPFVMALEKMISVYRKKRVDIFKDAISVPGVARILLHRSVPKNVGFSRFMEASSDIHKTFERNITGGPSIVFQR